MNRVRTIVVKAKGFKRPPPPLLILRSGVPIFLAVPRTPANQNARQHIHGLSTSVPERKREPCLNGQPQSLSDFSFIPTSLIWPCCFLREVAAVTTVSAATPESAIYCLVRVEGAPHQPTCPAEHYRATTNEHYKELLRSNLFYFSISFYKKKLKGGVHNAHAHARTRWIPTPVV